MPTAHPSRTPHCADGTQSGEAVSRPVAVQGQAETRAQGRWCGPQGGRAVPWPTHWGDKSCWSLWPRVRGWVAAASSSSSCPHAAELPSSFQGLEAMTPQGGAWKVERHLSTNSLGPPSGALSTISKWWRGVVQPSAGALSPTAVVGVMGSPGLSTPLDSAGLSLPVLWQGAPRPQAPNEELWPASWEGGDSRLIAPK